MVEWDVEVILRLFFSPKWDVRASERDEVPPEWKGFFRSAVHLTMLPQIDTRHTTVVSGEPTAAVWMLLQDRHEVRVWMGRRGIFGIEEALTARGFVPSALGVFRRTVL